MPIVPLTDYEVEASNTRYISRVFFYECREMPKCQSISISCQHSAKVEVPSSQIQKLHIGLKSPATRLFLGSHPTFLSS